MSKLFCIEILEEKPVISFDELLLIRSVIRGNEDTKESS
jgi:hypothetical protein